MLSENENWYTGNGRRTVVKYFQVVLAKDYLLSYANIAPHSDSLSNIFEVTLHLHQQTMHTCTAHDMHYWNKWRTKSLKICVYNGIIQRPHCIWTKIKSTMLFHTKTEKTTKTLSKIVNTSDIHVHSNMSYDSRVTGSCCKSKQNFPQNMNTCNKWINPSIHFLTLLSMNLWMHMHMTKIALAANQPR